ncbi:MAG: hypothetical protein QXK33_03330, partial [Candidatus Bathyarchaeia archaeon]
MVSENPFKEFRRECETILKNVLVKAFPEETFKQIVLERPPVLEFGQLASSICFELARKVGEKPLELAERLVKSVDRSKFSLVEDVTAAGGGYINFHANFAKFSALTIESI